MSNLSWCDFKNKGNLLECHDMCPNPKCKGQKQIFFTPNQFQCDGAVFRKTMKKSIQRQSKSSFSKPAVNTLAPVIGRAIGA